MFHIHFNYNSCDIFVSCVFLMYLLQHNKAYRDGQLVDVATRFAGFE